MELNNCTNCRYSVNVSQEIGLICSKEGSFSICGKKIIAITVNEQNSCKDYETNKN